MEKILKSYISDKEERTALIKTIILEFSKKTTFYKYKIIQDAYWHILRDERKTPWKKRYSGSPFPLKNQSMKK